MISDKEALQLSRNWQAYQHELLRAIQQILDEAGIPDWKKHSADSEESIGIVARVQMLADLRVSKPEA